MRTLREVGRLVRQFWRGLVRLVTYQRRRAETLDALRRIGSPGQES